MSLLQQPSHLDFLISCKLELEVSSLFFAAATITMSVVNTTYHGFVSDTRDALILFQAVLDHQLKDVDRRPHDKEKGDLIQSGSVFIFNEATSGIKRWTDNMNWSPSRILGNFLVYREKDARVDESKKPASKRSGSTGHAHVPSNRRSQLLQQNSQLSHSQLHQSRAYNPYERLNAGGQEAELYGYSLYDYDGRSSVSSSSSNTDGKLSSNGQPLPTSERSLVGSLQNNPQFKEGGLMKKTISVTFGGLPYHLVSYYKPDDVQEGKLTRPCNDPMFKSIKISDSLISQSFRVALDPSTALELSSSTNQGFQSLPLAGTPNLGYSSSAFGTAPTGLGLQSGHPVQNLGMNSLGMPMPVSMSMSGMYGVGAGGGSGSYNMQAGSAPQYVGDIRSLNSQSTVAPHSAPVPQVSPYGSSIPSQKSYDINQNYFGTASMTKSPTSNFTALFSNQGISQAPGSAPGSGGYQGQAYYSQYKKFGSASLPMPESQSPYAGQSQHLKSSASSVSKQVPSSASRPSPRTQVQSQHSQANKSQSQTEVSPKSEYQYEQPSRRSSTGAGESPSLPPLNQGIGGGTTGSGGGAGGGAMAAQTAPANQYQYYAHEYSPTSLSNPREMPWPSASKYSGVVPANVKGPGTGVTQSNAPGTLATGTSGADVVNLEHSHGSGDHFIANGTTASTSPAVNVTSSPSIGSHTAVRGAARNGSTSSAVAQSPHAVYPYTIGQWP